MGEYNDVKRKKMLQALKKLSQIDGFEITTEGGHQWMVKHHSWERPFPIAFKHNKVSKYYIKNLIKIIVKTGDCTKEDLDDWLI